MGGHMGGHFRKLPFFFVFFQIVLAQAGVGRIVLRILSKVSTSLKPQSLNVIEQVLPTNEKTDATSEG